MGINENIAIDLKLMISLNYRNQLENWFDKVINFEYAGGHDLDAFRCQGLVRLI